MKDDNNSGEELIAEQVEQLKAELEAEKAKAATAIEEATKPLTDRITSLEQDLQAKDEELTTTRTQLSEIDKGLASLNEEKEGAITAYRELIQKSNPIIPADMINGTTVADINTSLEKANALVGRIRSKVEEDRSNNSVPAGAGKTKCNQGLYYRWY
jgi:DNA repair exonuclease SbcCD ATPase subunit